MNKRYWIITAVLLVGFAIFALRPVPIAKEADCLSINGTVTDIYEGGEKDLVIKLRGRKKIYYINRGLERGLDLQQLKTALIDQEVVLKYPDYWTPLDPGRSSIHISKIEHGGRTVFSEIFPVAAIYYYLKCRRLTRELQSLRYDKNILQRQIIEK